MRTRAVCRICLYSAHRDASIDPNRRQSGAHCSETEIEGDPLAPVLPAFSSGPRASRSPHEHERAGSSRSGRCRPQDGNAGGAAIFPRAVSGRPFLLWPCRRRLPSTGGSRSLTPASGAWLFPDRIAGARPSTSGCESIPRSSSGEEAASDRQYVRCAFGDTTRHTGHDRLARPGGLGNLRLPCHQARRRLVQGTRHCATFARPGQTTQRSARSPSR